MTLALTLELMLMLQAAPAPEKDPAPPTPESFFKTLIKQESWTRPIANYPRAGLTVLGLM